MEKMITKDEIDRLFKLCDLMKNHVITYEQLLELKDLIGEDFEDNMNRLQFSKIDDVYSAIDSYKSSNNIERSKISCLISRITSIRYDFHNRYMLQNK